MSKSNKFVKKSSSGKPNSKLITVLSCIAAALLILVVALILLIPKEEVPAETTAPTTVPAETTVPTEAPTTVPPTTIPVETKGEILENMVENFQKNSDLAGWIKIDGTKADDPVMYVANDNFKYLYKNFNLKFDAAGVPFIDGGCSLDPESDNLIIYGHNMLDGDMFGQLKNYADKEFCKENPVIYFNTLYEEREYEVLAAFYDRIYDESEDCFKFYRFIDAVNEEEFNEAYNYWKEKSEYDTGVTAEFGDRFITLVTCSYHVNEGRFVVIARLIDETE